MGLLLLSAAFGESIAYVQLFGIRISYIILYTVVALAIGNSLYLIILDSKNVKDGINKFLPLTTMIVFIIAELMSSKLNLYKNKPLLVILLNGFYYSLFTCKLIIFNMAKKAINIFDIDIITYIIGIFTCVVLGSKIIEFYVLIGLLVWLCYRYYMQIIYSIFRMLDYLKIPF